MILIGSRALFIRNKKLLNRDPNDFDFLAEENEAIEWLEKNKTNIGSNKIYYTESRNKLISEGDSNIEFELSRPGSSTEQLISLVKNDPETLSYGKFGLVPNLDILFLIKASHRYSKDSPHFWKTMMDYHIMKKAGCKIREEYKELLALREKETYTFKHPNLNVDKKSFFHEEEGFYKYDHDSLHRAVSYPEAPAYTLFMKDNAEVKSDKNKFMALDMQTKIKAVIEESAVLALERSIIPHPGVLNPEQAWRLAFSKVCSSITSGWFREWAYENAIECLKAYPKDYVDKFNYGLENNIVKAFK